MCTIVVSFTCKELQVWCWCVWPCRWARLVTAACAGWARQLCLYRHNCLTALLGWWLGSCGCTGTTVSLHCWAGGWVVVVVPAQLYHCWAGGWWLVAQVELQAGAALLLVGWLQEHFPFLASKHNCYYSIQFFKCWLSQEKASLYYCIVLFSILYIHYSSNWLQVF